MRPSRFWLLHAWLPAALFLTALTAIAALDLDRRLADALFFDRASGTWIGADRWWAVDLVHTGGALFVRLAGLTALAAWVASLFSGQLRGLRLRAGYVVLGMILCTSVVGGLKQVTRVDCPRDLAGFGGDRPYALLLAYRAGDYPPGHCYPGAHASSGFSLMALYFAWRDRRPRLARGALAATLGIGIVFSVGQQARGAHFLSHDLMSAGLAWFLLLALWHRLLESPAPDAWRLISPAAHVQRLNGTPPHGPGLAERPGADPAHARGRRARLRVVLQRLFPARLPLRAAAPQWRRRSHA